MKVKHKLAIRGFGKRTTNVSVSVPLEMRIWLDKVATENTSDRSKVIQACIKKAMDEYEVVGA